jgi:hypothetical protein
MERNAESNKNFALISILLFAFIILIPCFLADSYGAPIKKAGYEITRSKIEREIQQGEIVRDSFTISNLRSASLKVSIYASPEISDIVELDEVGALINSYNSTEFFFNVLGKEQKNYIGTIRIANDINEELPVNITVTNTTSKARIALELSLIKPKITLGSKIELKLKILNQRETEPLGNVSFTYTISNEDNSTYLLTNETNYIKNSYQVIKKFNLPESLTEGFYIIRVEAISNKDIQITSAEIRITKSFWNILIFGIVPVWALAAGLSAFLIVIFIAYLIKMRIEKNKKYKMQVDMKTLPVKTDRSIWLGKIAETNNTSYYDLDSLTTHLVVAGATGGGKSIAAQVFVEEALRNNIAVIVFDPTAQWSGMLRKCEDKKMLSFYPKFGMKPTDARGFPGNIRQIVNERQKIDVKKYMNPGNIQVFTMNKLTPPQIDTFVASVIVSIFGSDPQEHPNLKMLLVFDEVHRLLPKFGGSGKGFLQIERACREFRKWGFGVMLVSQVLSDFVGEIKANINTEVQMRTRDESDLNRIKTKYGEEFLQSLIKASVGVGMVVNAKYNRGRPYFVNYRPILHNTKRLTDEILEQYNKYGEIIDDLEYQLKQLEELKIDIFDLKMELKLVKDKLTSGNFTVVDIYLEELLPRVKEKWEAIKKKPKKLEIELIKEGDIASSLTEAKKSRAKWQNENKK